MKYLKSILIIVLFLITSCKGDLIPRKEMSYIIADIYKADRYVTSQYELLLAADSIQIYEAVFNHYGYTGAEFTNTIEHYLSRPTKLKEIYAGAKAIVEEQEIQVSNDLKYKNRLDSIRVIYTRLLKKAESVVKLLPEERAVRWILEPLKYARWSFSYNDSIRELYENPQMTRWWLNNFKKDTTTLKPFLVNEKDSRAVPISPKLKKANLKRTLNP
ncbi:MAG: DUF4296 domain-containing protein [Bacteroidales bacterium]|nr:DUF4296 domain-containing protein [Bacteroidales bacterium]MDD4656310.1 DUF4296 domain-containing protein [Bacteroidales bacterium]